MLAPHIPSRDPLIRLHESEYMPTPTRLAGSWGYGPLVDWARGPTPDQEPFQALGYVPSSPENQIDPSIGPIADDDSLWASHVLLYHDDVAPTWACFSHFSCTSQTLTLGGPNLYIYQIASWQAWTVCIILPLGKLQTCMYYIAPQWTLLYDIASRQAPDVRVDIASWQALYVCFQIFPVGRLSMYA